jgi:hypothetical protein
MDYFSHRTNQTRHSGGDGHPFESGDCHPSNDIPVMSPRMIFALIGTCSLGG